MTLSGKQTSKLTECIGGAQSRLASINLAAKAARPRLDTLIDSARQPRPQRELAANSAAERRSLTGQAGAIRPSASIIIRQPPHFATRRPPSLKGPVNLVSSRLGTF